MKEKLFTHAKSDTYSCTLKIRGGCEVDSHGVKAGKGALIQWERSATLGVTQDQTLFIWIDAEHDTDEIHQLGIPSSRFADHGDQ